MSRKVLIKVCPGADGYGGNKALWRLYQKDVAVVVLWPLDLGAWPSPDAEDMVRFLHRPRDESRRLPADGPGIGILSVEASGGLFCGEPVDLNRIAHG